MTKEDFWAAEDAGMLNLSRFRRAHFSIKNMQDAVVLHRLGALRDKDIFEAGGGHSRVLGHYCRNNRCANIDPLEGEGGGPTRRKVLSRHHFEPYRQIFASVGRSSSVIAEGSCDVLFSISVIEHVPLNAIDIFFADIARILRPGGRMLHLIDSYLGEDPGINAEAVERFPAYARVFETGSFVPADRRRIMSIKDIRFHPRMATNPDNSMNEWNRLAPSLRHVRAEGQACTFILDAVRV